MELQGLLQVLKEGDRRLYDKAAGQISACAEKLGVASDAAIEYGGLEKMIAAAKNLVPGRHGIRLFTAAFAARDIQEPLISFDAESLTEVIRGEAAGPVSPVIGIRTNGVVTGYLAGEGLSGEESPVIRQFDPGQMVEIETSLADVIHVLTQFRYCFVTLDEAVIGVIGRGDMEKPAVRMWLFGIIILIEMLVVGLIREQWPDESWVPLVSEGRLEKAKALQEERARRGLSADLVDCLQFSDKIQIAMHEPKFVEGAGFHSLGSAKRAVKELESLRNNLAHGQYITRTDWPPIVRLAQRVQQLFGR